MYRVAQVLSTIFYSYYFSFEIVYILKYRENASNTDLRRASPRRGSFFCWWVEDDAPLFFLFVFSFFPFCVGCVSMHFFINTYLGRR